MNKKQIALGQVKIFALIFVAALILPFGNIRAQEVQPEVLTVEQQVEEQTAPEPLETTSEQTVVLEAINPETTSVSETPTQKSATATETVAVSAASTEADLDENITAEDLNVSEQTILPTNPYYPLKSIWRGIKSALTFNPVKKAELKLQYANEKLIEVKKMVEEKSDPEATAKAMESYQKEVAGIFKIVEKSSEQIKVESENFAERIIDYSFKQQKLIDGLEKKMEPQQTGLIQEIKNQNLENLGKTLGEMIPTEQINNKISGVIDNQKGSEFKNFKNLEVLKAVEQKVPEAAREAIRQAQQNVLQKLEINISQSQEKEKFQNYVANIGGNEIGHLEIIQEMTQKEISQTVRQELEKAKEKAVGKIEKKIETMSEEQQKEFLAPLEQGNIENLRTLKELENNLSPETVDKILEVKNTAIDNFRKNFESTTTTSEQQTAYSNKIEELHDVKQLEVLKEVEKVIPQEKKELFSQIQEKVINGMENEIKNAKNQEQKNLVLEKIAGNSPEQITIIKELKPSLEIMNAVLGKQAEKIQERVQNAENVEKIQNLKERIIKIENVKEELEKRAPEIMNRVEEKIEEKAEELTSEKAKEQIEKTKNELQQILENKDFEKYLTDSALIEVVKKRLDEAETAFNQGDFGQAFGQAIAGLHQIVSLKKMIKEKELQQNVAQERIGQMEQKMENLVNEFLKSKTAGEASPPAGEASPPAARLPARQGETGGETEPGVIEKISDEIKQGTLEKEWLEYKNNLEPQAKPEKTIELPLDKMNLSNQEKQQIKDVVKILPQEIKEKLNNIPQEMLIETVEKLKEKITSPTLPAREEKKTEIANPASEFCIKKGGNLEIKTDEKGGQFGVCHLPDGTTCEEWALFRGECPQDSKGEKTLEDKETPNSLCPELPRPVCKNGIIIPVDKDKNGCPLSLKCMGLGVREPPTVKCDIEYTLDPNWCKDGKIVYPVGIDKNGCQLPPKCVKSEMEQMPTYGPTLPPASPSESNHGSILPKKSPSVCIQVITPAMKDGICREFPTPCDVPDGWQRVERCEKSIDSRIQMDIPSTGSQKQQLQPEPLPQLKPSQQQTQLEKPVLPQEQSRPEPTIKPESQSQPQMKPIMKPEGSLGKPSLIEKIKNLLK